MNSTSIVSSVVIIFILLGETFFRDVFHPIWLGLSILFFIFLIVFHYMDHKGMFTPDKMYKKKNKED